MNTLLIDADVFCYLYAYRNETAVDWDGDGNVEVYTQPAVALAEVNSFVGELKETLKGNRVYFILSDTKANFRKELAPSYKASRSKRPELWSVLRNYIEFGDHGYPVRQFPRLEGDDVLGMMATHPQHGKRTIMVSIDKDMRTVPGRLYLFNKPKLGVIHTSWEDSVRFHMTQTLTGDAVDEYKGIPGVGPKKAEAFLDGVAPRDMWDAVVAAYELNGLTEEDALLQARLAYILQHGDYRKEKIRLWDTKRLERS